MRPSGTELLEGMQKVHIEGDPRNGTISNGASRSPSHRRAPVPRISLADLLNDLYHAHEIVELHGKDIRHCKQLGGFLVWNGRRWAPDRAGTVWRLAIRTTAHVYREQKRTDAGKRRFVEKWALNATRAKNIKDALIQLQAQSSIIAPADAFDRDPFLFTAQNGTIDLRTGELREHRREDMITKIAPVAYDPDAGPPRLWTRFLHEMLDGNRELIDFIQRACGYALTGSGSEQKLFFLHGNGPNGKRTFLHTLMHVMGTYARPIPPDSLFRARADQRSTASADLTACRLAVITEPGAGRYISGAALNRLAGDCLISRSAQKVFVTGDHLPLIRDGDRSSWRRMILIPLTVTIPEHRRDKDLPHKLRAEAAGILNWIVTGCLEWQKKGLSEPAAVAGALRAYRTDMDVLGDFLSDRCTIDDRARSTTADIIRAYTTWCQENGERPMTACRLGLRLKERGFRKTRTSSARIWHGLALKDERAR